MLILQSFDSNLNSIRKRILHNILDGDVTADWFLRKTHHALNWFEYSHSFAKACIICFQSTFDILFLNEMI